MASLKQIRRRITGVTNTRQITRAMKMVAAARMRRAQENMERARPYSWKLRDTISSLAAHSDSSKHPLLEIKEPHKIGIVCVTSDRGLAGGFNSNICRRTELLLKEHADKDVELITLGKKGYEYFKKKGVTIHDNYASVFQEMDFSQAVAIGEAIAKKYVGGAFDRFYVVFNEFKNAIQQNIIAEQLLPIIPEVPEETEWEPVEYIYEPDATTVLETILPKYLNIEIWHVLLESFASEQAARMTAMDNATNNANDLIKSLTLQFNKARQAAITTEINEIVGGAEGLK